MSASAKRLAKGSTRRVEIHTGWFLAHTMGLTPKQVGQLMECLMADAIDAPIPPIEDHAVQRVWDRRDEFSRIRGGYGRTSISLRTRQDIFERDDRQCQYCGAALQWSNYHCDHVEPVAKGGSDHHSNLVAACRGCNLSKAARSLREWRP